MLNLIEKKNKIQTLLGLKPESLTPEGVKTQTNEVSNEVKTEVKSDLTIFFYLTHVKREEIGPLIQFLQKFNLNFRRITNEKQILASNYIRQNSNFMAQSSKPISFEQFQMITKFLDTKTIVVGYEYKNAIWNASRTTRNSMTHPSYATWNIFKSIAF